MSVRVGQAVRRELEELEKLLAADQPTPVVKRATATIAAFNDYSARYAEMRRRAMRILHDDFGWSLTDLGSEFKLSKQRVSQIINQ